VRKAARLSAQLGASKAVSFKDCAKRYIAADQPPWRNSKHAAQWDSTSIPMSIRYSAIWPCNFPAEVAEMALARAVSDKVEAAYRRGDLFQSDANSRKVGRSSALPRRAPQRLCQSAKPLQSDR
jgi:hypothetical protein